MLFNVFIVLPKTPAPLAKDPALDKPVATFLVKAKSNTTAPNTPVVSIMAPCGLKLEDSTPLSSASFFINFSCCVSSKPVTLAL